MNENLFYITTHLKFSTLFYSSQLLDICAYELPHNLFSLPLGIKQNFLNINNFYNNLKSTSSITIYNFHVLTTQNHIYLYTQNLISTKNFYKTEYNSLDSISELFFSANWLEREVSELHGNFFSGKKDIRNLMLQYGDSSIPFQKSFPSIGLKEMYYNPVQDTLIQNPVSLQL